MYKLRLVPVGGAVSCRVVEVGLELRGRGTPVEVLAGGLDEEGVAGEGEDAAGDGGVGGVGGHGFVSAGDLCLLDTGDCGESAGKPLLG